MKEEPQPPQYSITAESEEISIGILNHFLDKTKISSQISRNDKTPGSDGYIVLKDQRKFVGRVEVQVKTLSINKLSYSLSLDMLAYIKKAQLPFLFIGVDQKNEKMYWKEITRGQASSLINEVLNKENKSITIHLDKTNEIRTNPPYSYWNNLISDHSKILDEYPELKDKLLIAEEKLRAIQFNNSEGDKNKNYTNYNLFLDYLNSLFNDKFLFVKQVFNFKFYRFGIIIFGDIEDDKITYSLFPIMLEDNIRPVITWNGESLNEFMAESHNAIRYFKYNPIASDPRKYANVVFWFYLELMFKRDLIWPNDEILKNEYIFENYDRQFRSLDPYAEKLELFQLKEHIESYLKMLPDNAPEKNTIYSNSLYSLNRMLDYIQDYRIMGMSEIERVVPKWDIEEIKRTVLFEGKYPESIKDVLTRYWSKYYEMYENVINEFFFSIKSQLEISRVNTIIIVPYLKSFNANAAKPHMVPYLELIKLRSENVLQKSLIVEVENGTIKRQATHIEYNDKRFEFFSSETISFSQLSQEFALRKEVLSQLKREISVIMK